MYHLLLVGLALLVPANAGIPDYLSAVSYDLSFTFNPSIDLETFTAEANIVLKTSNETGTDKNNFVLNGYDLSMEEISVVYPSTRKIHVDAKKIIVDKKEQTVTLPLPEALLPSKEYKLRILYSGKINDDSGLVRTKYNDGSDYLVTVLYPASARRMYPSIDQPNMRATYNVTINVNYNGDEPTIITGLRKADDSKTDKKNKKLVVTYNSNGMPIPPYAIAFTIGSYKTVEANLRAPTNMKNVLVCKNAIYALQAKTIESLKKAANLESLNLVIVPGLPVNSVSGYGFAAISQDLGTEMDASSTPGLMQQGIAVLSALVKSIYGSIISPASWNDIWISESVPLYISNAALSEIPRWKDWSTMGIIHAQQAALKSTWSEDSWPVKPNNIASVNDLLKFLSSPAIHKGAAILGMVESISSNSSVIKAFVNLVNDMNGKAISTEELFDKYEEYNQLNGSLPEKMKLKDLISPWLKQTGYPAISVVRKSNDIIATQSRFGPNQKTQSTWVVPIYYTQNSSYTALKWLNSVPNTELLLATNVKASDVITVNIKGPGMYRVLYNEQDVLLVGKQLQNDVNFISPEVRTGLNSDGLAFARVGSLRYSVVLEMMAYLEKERSLGPWTVVSKGLREMWSLLYFTDLKTQFENYSTGLLRNSYIDSSIGGLGLTDPSLMNGQLRRLIVGQLCDYNDLNCREDASAAFNKYILTNKETDIVAVDMVPVIYCNGLRHLEKPEEMQALLNKKYVSSAPQDVKRNVFSYLACAVENDTREGLLNAVLLDGFPTVKDILPEDIVIAFEEVAHRPEQIGFLLDFFINNYNKLKQSLKEEHKAQMVQAIGQLAVTNDHSKLLGNLKYGNSSLVKEAVNQALVSIQSRSTFLTNNYEEIKKGLYGRSPGPTPTLTPTPTPTPPGPTPNPNTTEKPNGAAGITGAVCLILTAVFTLLISH